MNHPSLKEVHLQTLDALQKTKNKHIKKENNHNASTTPKQSAPKASKPKSTPRPKSEGPIKSISIQHMSAAKPKLQNRMLYDVLSYLKEVDKEVAIDQISADLPGYDFTHAGTIKELQANAKINFDNGKYAYKPMYPVRNIIQLHELINKTPNGIEVEQLKDSYKTAEADIKKLAEQKDIIVIKNEETKFDNVYPNYDVYRISVSEEFVKLWRATKTPDEVELERELKAAGIVSAKETEVKPKKRPQQKKEPRKRKLQKITNAHILKSGVDIITNYTPAPAAKK